MRSRHIRRNGLWVHVIAFVIGLGVWLVLLHTAYTSDVAGARQGQYRVLGAQGAITTRDSAEVERAGYTWGN